MSIQKSERSPDLTQRLTNLDKHFTFSLYQNVCRSLLEKDKLLFSFILTVRILMSKDKIDPVEWYFALTGGVAMENVHQNPVSDWLSEKQWGEVTRLSELKSFNGLREEFSSGAEEWKRIYDSSYPHQEHFPGKWETSLEGVQRLCLLRCLRPDKIILAVQDFVASEMGEKYVKPPPFDLEACYQDSSNTCPLVFILSAGSDPMGAVLKASEAMKREVSYISLGQGQGPIAERMITKAKTDGSWVVLQNCHLAPSWMTTLEKITEEFHPTKTNTNFRLWCTTYPSNVFPVSVLQNSVKMTVEPPKGIRANLLGSYKSDPIVDPEFFDSCSKGPEFRRLLYGLCFFHALVQERRLFGPIGWNIPYEFNLSDLKISVKQIAMFLNENDYIPFKALNYCTGECNYGGRVTDDKDRRTLNCILLNFFNKDFLAEDHNITPSGSYKAPPDGTYEDFLGYIETLPLSAPPEVFGLHENATITKDQNDTNKLFEGILSTEKGNSGGGGGASKEEMILMVAADILSKIPKNFDMENAMIRYPVKWEESMNTVLCQELIRFNNLLDVIRNSLINIQKAVKGLIVMSSELDVLGSNLFFGIIPVMWKAKSYPSLKNLGGYITDLLDRLNFFKGWLEDRPPSIFWISGFFFTQAFLTGASQNFARRYTIPIDNVVFDFEMMPLDNYRMPPKDGVYVQGLFIEGCRWNMDTMLLDESYPKILFSPAPVIWYKPVKKEDLSYYPNYNCPVYKTGDRRGVLSTTGHSTNFISFIRMPSDKSEEHWVKRGVCMLTQLNE
ncbi:MAG: hypothetical protein CMJ88_10175 [Planctomycetes bacterium]|nr:hypothetical protein [Planctomycetota bacterium]